VLELKAVETWGEDADAVRGVRAGAAEGEALALGGDEYRTDWFE
jgi:hypothetical protein